MKTILYFALIVAALAGMANASAQDDKNTAAHEALVNNSVVNTFALNAEYEAIIATATSSGKDPLDYVTELKTTGKMNFTQVRAFNRYLMNRNTATNTAEKQRAIDKSKILENGIYAKSKELLKILIRLDKEGKIGSEQKRDINFLYYGAYVPTEIKTEIMANLGQYIEPRNLAIENQK